MASIRGNNEKQFAKRQPNVIPITLFGHNIGQHNQRLGQSKLNGAERLVAKSIFRAKYIAAITALYAIDFTGILCDNFFNKNTSVFLLMCFRKPSFSTIAHYKIKTTIWRYIYGSFLKFHRKILPVTPLRMLLSYGGYAQRYDGQLGFYRRDVG